MIAYPDTSFLCSLYREQVHPERADAYRETMTEPLHFTRLLEFEFLQAIELQFWLNATVRKKGYARREADQMLEDWETDIASGLNKVVPYDSDAVLRLVGSYSKNRTAQVGQRSLDICMSPQPFTSGQGISDLRRASEHAGTSRRPEDSFVEKQRWGHFPLWTILSWPRHSGLPRQPQPGQPLHGHRLPNRTKPLGERRRRRKAQHPPPDA